MEIPTRPIKFLNESKVSYEILHHPEAFTAQTIAQAEHIIKGRHHAKVVMVKIRRRALDFFKLAHSSAYWACASESRSLAVRLNLQGCPAKAPPSWWGCRFSRINE